MEDFNQELQKLREITNKLTENGYLVDRTTQWEFAFDAVPDLVVIVNPRFRIKFVNKAFAERIDVNKAELLNQQAFSAIYDISDKDGNACTAFNDHFRLVEMPEIFIGSLDGWFNFTRTPIFDADNNLLGYVCILRDITTRKRMDRALQESEERFRNVYKTAPLAFVIWDLKARVIGWNIQAEELFGWSKEEIIGNDFFDFIIPEKDLDHVKNIVDDLLEGTPINRSINENITKEGKIVTCEWNNSALHDDAGDIIGVISLGLNLSPDREDKICKR